jgi:hypothetical protein
LNLGGIPGMYFQVAGIIARPRYMDEGGYRRYLKEAKKKELRRDKITITKPEAAQMKLEELLSRDWTWGVLPHNCAAFVEEILAAGGSNAGTYSNCPAHETFK